MTDPKALREKLDAMYRDRVKDEFDRDYFSSAFVYRSIALDLLARLDAAETPCVWNHVEGKFQQGCDKVMWLFFAPKFCPGCRHPVQVFPQDAERKEK